MQGNYRLTAESSDADVRHIILNFEGQPFPVLEGQSLGVIAPGLDGKGKPHLPRLYSVSSPRDGERPNFNNVSLDGEARAGRRLLQLSLRSRQGRQGELTGPFGATFLMPNDPKRAC